MFSEQLSLPDSPTLMYYILLPLLLLIALLLFLDKWALKRLLNKIILPCYSSDSVDIKRKSIIFRAYDRTTTLFEPCYLGEDIISDKAVVYFHGNEEDLGEIRENLKHIARELRANVFAAEYPGYGVNQNPNTKEQQWTRGNIHEKVKEQATTLYRFLHEELHFPHENIIVVGRSIGSGPACHVAATQTCPTLILISPFLNIKNMIREKTCQFLSDRLEEVFPNDENVGRAKARLMVVHGQRDSVISVENSYGIREVYEGRGSGRDGVFVFPEYMTHNRYDMRGDIIEPMKRFLEGSGESKGNAGSLAVLRRINERRVR